LLNWFEAFLGTNANASAPLIVFGPDCGGFVRPISSPNLYNTCIMSHAQQKKKGGNEPWRNKERHYCSVCNAWMASDRQSILLHENGKKHREAVEFDLKRRREEKSKKEKDKKNLNSLFAKINGAVGDIPAPGFGNAKPWEIAAAAQEQEVQCAVAPEPPPAKREKNKPAKNEPFVPPLPPGPPPEQPPFDPNHGHYKMDGTIYLEGQVYSNVLEAGMPVHLWMGSSFATDLEKRDLRNYNLWKTTALLAKVVKKRPSTDSKEKKVTCHVSYLLKPTDEDETLEMDVPPSRIRLVVGSDPLIPGTLEEAHLALMGGRHEIDVSKKPDPEKDKIDDNTGLTGWSTTTIRKTSQHYEQLQEKTRQRQHEKELAEYKEKKEKEIQARKMEEAKYENAHDSALGAYDVWSSANAAGGIEGKTRAYKGVDITKETKLSITDTAKSLSKGMGSVAFKKKKIKKKGNARKKSADDD